MRVRELTVLVSDALSSAIEESLIDLSCRGGQWDGVMDVSLGKARDATDAEFAAYDPVGFMKSKGAEPCGEGADWVDLAWRVTVSKHRPWTKESVDEEEVYVVQTLDGEWAVVRPLIDPENEGSVEYLHGFDEGELHEAFHAAWVEENARLARRVEQHPDVKP